MFAIISAVLFFLISLGWIDRSNDVVNDMLVFSFAFFVLHFGWPVAANFIRSRRDS